VIWFALSRASVFTQRHMLYGILRSPIRRSGGSKRSLEPPHISHPTVLWGSAGDRLLARFPPAGLAIASRPQQLTAGTQTELEKLMSHTTTAQRKSSNRTKPISYVVDRTLLADRAVKFRSLITSQPLTKTLPWRTNNKSI